MSRKLIEEVKRLIDSGAYDGDNDYEVLENLVKVLEASERKRPALKFLEDKIRNPSKLHDAIEEALERHTSNNDNTCKSCGEISPCADRIKLQDILQQ